MSEQKHRTQGADAPLSATFTVTAETPSELAYLLRGVAQLLEESAARTASAETRPPRSLANWVDAELVRDLWRTVTRPASAEALSWYSLRGLDFLDHLTPESREAVLFVASHAPRVAVSELAEEVGKDPGSPLAGLLSSIGYAWKRLGAPEPPFERVRSMYEMDPRLASHLLRLAAKSTDDSRR